MTLEQEAAFSLAELGELSDAACRAALEHGAAVDLVVEGDARRDARKLALCARPGLAAGVRVQTWDEWVAGLWDLHGDGRRVVTGLQRRVLLRPLVAESGLLAGPPSTRLVDELASFVAEAVAPGVSASLADMASSASAGAAGDGATPASGHETDETLRKVATLVGAYEEALKEHGLVEQAQAEALIARELREFAGSSAAAAHAVVLEAAYLASPHRQAFVAALAESLPVTRIDRRLRQLDADAAPDAAATNAASSPKGAAAPRPEAAAVPAPGAAAAAPAPSAGAAPLPELAELRERLYSGRGGLKATGAVFVGQARGAHAEDAVTCALVRRFLDAGARPGQVAVVFPNAAESYPHVQLTLARAGIPFEARFSLPAARTPFGSAFCELMQVRSAPGSDDSRLPLADFIATPYAGIDGRDARALQMRWRERSGSTPEARMADIREGFAQGNATTTTTRARLLPLAEMLDPARTLVDCVWLMLDHARGCRGREAAPRRGSASEQGAAPEQPEALERSTSLGQAASSGQETAPARGLVDDEAAASALLDYLVACEQLGAEPSPGELAACRVPLERSFAPEPAAAANAPGTGIPVANAATSGASGESATVNVPAPEPAAADAAGAVLLTSASELAPGSRRCLVVPGLDAQRYPMASQPGPFDLLQERLGIAQTDDMVLRQRVLLQDLVELASGGIAFARATHGAEGDERVGSALWDELMSVYRAPEDDAADLPVQDIPAALGPHAVRLSEAAVFARSALAAPSPATQKGPSPLRQHKRDRPFYVAGGGSSSAAPAVRPVVRGRLADPELVALLTHDLAGKETPFSPTGLEDYYRCPYRWFACRRVGYNGMDAEFDASAQGNLAHAALERFYRALQASGQRRVTPDNLPAALELVSRSLDEQLAHDEKRSSREIVLRTERDRYEVEEIRARLQDLVRRDAVFLPGFAPACFELTLGKGTGAMLEYAGVPVRGKVDRIDVDGEGNAVVIDYKLSGLSAGYGLDPERDVPGRIQTDIYARLVQRHFDLLGEPLRVVGSVYRSYSRNSLRGAYARGIDWGPEETVREDRDALPRSGRSEDYDAYLDLVEDTVAGCVERLHAGHIEPAPLDGDVKGVCEYCKALAFCPVGGGA